MSHYKQNPYKYESSESATGFRSTSPKAASAASRSTSPKVAARPPSRATSPIAREVYERLDRMNSVVSGDDAWSRMATAGSRYNSDVSRLNSREEVAAVRRQVQRETGTSEMVRSDAPSVFVTPRGQSSSRQSSPMRPVKSLPVPTLPKGAHGFRYSPETAHAAAGTDRITDVYDADMPPSKGSRNSSPVRTSVSDGPARSSTHANETPTRAIFQMFPEFRNTLGKSRSSSPTQPKSPRYVDAAASAGPAASASKKKSVEYKRRLNDLEIGYLRGRLTKEAYSEAVDERAREARLTATRKPDAVAGTFKTPASSSKMVIHVSKAGHVSVYYK